MFSVYEFRRQVEKLSTTRWCDGKRPPIAFQIDLASRNRLAGFSPAGVSAIFLLASSRPSLIGEV